MASITSLMNSNYNTSSIYGNRNILSGLASGMDTESMIENAVSGIKLKIQNLLKKRTKVEWQQEAYRSIIDKAVNINTKYTSYASKTNLLSSSFFNNAVNTVAKGTYADKIIASGKSSSDIKINAVKQLATSASYTVSGSAAFGGDFSTISGSEGVDLSADMDVSRISGSLTLQYGGSNGTSFNLNFDELDIYDNAEDLADAIREKLDEQTYSYTKNGVQETVKGSDVVDVRVNANGNITFSDKTSGGNAVYISSAVGDIKDTLGVTTGISSNILRVSDTDLSEKISTREYLSDKELSFSLNGVNKTIKMNDVLDKIDSSYDSEGDSNTQFVNALQGELDKAFGSGKVKVSQDGESGKLSFKAAEDGSTLTIGGSAVKAIGFESGDSNYINTSRKLGDILGEGVFSTSSRLKAVGDVTEKSSSAGTYYVDSKGNKVEQAEDGEYYQIDDTGKAIYDFEINGAHIKVTEDTTLEGLMNSINSNIDAGVKVSYSKLTNEFKFTANGTGANSKIEFGGLAEAIFSPSSGVSGSDSFSDVYGLNVEEGNRSFYIPYRLKPGGNFWDDDCYVNVTGDMTDDEIKAEVEKRLQDWGVDGDYNVTYKDGQLVITDSDGQEAAAAQAIKRVTFEIPGEGSTNFAVTSDMTMEDIVKELNESPFSAFGYTASIDEQSGQIVMKDEDGNLLDLKITNDNETVTNEDGEEVKQELKKTGFSAVYTAGTDAIMDVEINGKRFTDFTRSSNNFDIDGMNITVKDTFEAEGKDGAAYEPITFETTTDTDKIINAIRDFVNDYNEMVTELKGAYSTQPLTDSKKNRYDPLTAEQEDGMTESEIKAYEEKAKQGILFGDTTLSSMYSRLLSSIQPGGTDGQTLREIGIGTSYSNGLTTLSLDEDKLRAALEGNPDKVKDAFTKTREGGSATDGLMQTLQNNLNAYVKTTGEPKGVLITRAGSVKAPTSLNNNSLNTQINNIDKQVERWQNKMASQIDRYTAQFSRLEQLIAAMNSQASAMAGLMGGSEGYGY